MYQVNLGDKILYYPANNTYAIYDTKLNEEVGAAGEFSFKVPPTNPLYGSLTQGALVTILKDGAEYWRGEIKEISTDFAKVADVYCLEDLAFLAEEYLTPTSIKRETYAQRFQAAIEAYNGTRPADRQFTAGYITNVESSGACDWTTEYDESVLDSIRKCICGESGYLRVRRVDIGGGNATRYIDIVKLSDYGSLATQSIEYGYNLLDYVKESNYEDLTNVLFPYGAELDAEVYEGYSARLQGTPIENADSLAVFGRHAKAVIFDDIEDEDQLNAVAAAYLAKYSQPVLTMEVEAVDLSGIDNVSEFKVGDSVRIISKPFAVDQWLYLTEIKRDLQNIDKNKITLSGSVQTGRTLTSQAQASADFVKSLPSKASILDAAQKNALQILNGENGGYVTFETNDDDQITELRIANHMLYDQATKCWRWNINGLAYLHRNTPSDNWSVSIAATMDGGFVADFITTGNLVANNGVYELNMATGRVTMKDAVLTDTKGTVVIENGNLKITRTSGNGPGVFAYQNIYHNATWGSNNSSCQWSSTEFLEVPTRYILEVADYFRQYGGWSHN